VGGLLSLGGYANGQSAEQSVVMANENAVQFYDPDG
jgi:hypothetical protein